MEPQYIGGIQVRTKLVITETNKTNLAILHFAGSVPPEIVGHRNIVRCAVTIRNLLG